MKRIITPNGVESHGSDARLVHNKIKEAAQELAGAHYDALASKSTQFYRDHPSQKIFVRTEWKHYVKDARAFLSHLLALSTTPPDQKAEIYEALKLHNELPWSQQETQIVNVQH